MSSKIPVSEKSIETYLVKKVKALGGLCIKMVPTFAAGIPDRQVLLNGRSVFVELKAPGKKPTPLQIHFSKQLKQAGFDVEVIDTKAGVDEFLKRLTDEVPGQ